MAENLPEGVEYVLSDSARELVMLVHYVATQQWTLATASAAALKETMGTLEKICRGQIDGP